MLGRATLYCGTRIRGEKARVEGTVVDPALDDAFATLVTPTDEGVVVVATEKKRTKFVRQPQALLVGHRPYPQHPIRISAGYDVALVTCCLRWFRKNDGQRLRSSGTRRRQRRILKCD